MHAKIGAIGGYDNALTATLDVSEMSLHNGSEELIGVDGLKIDSMTLKGNELDIGHVTIHNPRGEASRDADGSIIAAGLRLQLPKAAQPTPNTATQQANALPTPSQQSAATAPSTGPASEPFVAVLKQLTVDNAQLHLADIAVTPNVNTTAFVTANVNDLTIGRHAAPANFNVQLTCEGIIDDLKLDAEQLDPTPVRNC